jgi:hypothetical protein
VVLVVLEEMGVGSFWDICHISTRNFNCLTFTPPPSPSLILQSPYYNAAQKMWKTWSTLMRRSSRICIPTLNCMWLGLFCFVLSWKTQCNKSCVWDYSCNNYIMCNFGYSDMLIILDVHVLNFLDRCTMSIWFYLLNQMWHLSIPGIYYLSVITDCHDDWICDCIENHPGPHRGLPDGLLWWNGYVCLIVF